MFKTNNKVSALKNTKHKLEIVFNNHLKQRITSL